MLTNEEQIFQVVRREETGDEAFIGLARIEEVDIVSIGHEGKGTKALAFLDLGDIEFGLGLRKTWVDAGFFASTTAMTSPLGR